MATQRRLYAIPVAIQQEKLVAFTRAALQTGVSLRRATGPLGRQVAERTKTHPVQPGFAATHLIVVDQADYFQGLDARLAAEGGTRDVGDFSHIDLDGIARQVLISITLLSHCTWQVGGTYTFDYPDSDFPYRSGGYSHRETVSVAQAFRYSAASGWFRDLKASELRRKCVQLDCYYRSGTWWFDRLSVALGYLWSGLTTTHSELAFVSFCMALEAIASTSNNEITHILAERCALLTESDLEHRLRAYSEVKDLYELRSKIVHGRSAPKKGPITSESLAITAKLSVVPHSELLRILAYVVAVINGVLRRPELMALLHVKRSEENASKALHEYFQRLLLRGET